MTETLRNFKPFFSFFAASFFKSYTSFTVPFITCPLFCEFFIALIAKEPYCALCFLVLLKKTHLVFIVFLLNLFLNAVSIA